MWITRGKKYRTQDYLGIITVDLNELKKKHEKQPNLQFSPDTPITKALPKLIRERGMVGKDIEYGCFEIDGTLIDDPNLLKFRRRRNILYYTISRLYNKSRGFTEFSPGLMSSPDPVPISAENNWAVLMSENCLYKKDIERAIEPLVKHRGGRILTIPKLTVDTKGSREWIENCGRESYLPKYLLICDSFQNIEIEFQFILNAFSVTGRLWFDHPEHFEIYASKVLAVESHNFENLGRLLTVASPVDEFVTSSDYQRIIKPILSETEFKLDPLLFSNNFSKKTLTSKAKLSRFLALYCHGVGLRHDQLMKNPEYQGSFVIKFNAEDDSGLLIPEELAEEPFVPGGILFSPACFAGGTQADSDFATWIDQDDLPPYLSNQTSFSTISKSLLSAPRGPIAALLHMDISLCTPMYNPASEKYDLQTMLHRMFVRNLVEGQTLGKATKPFRSAAGTYYGQAIHIFGQVAGINSIMGWRKEPSIGTFVNSMNKYHIIATEMRNQIIFGDPAVRLSN